MSSNGMSNGTVNASIPNNAEQHAIIAIPANTSHESGSMRDIIMFLVILFIVILVCCYFISATPDLTGSIAYFATLSPPSGWLICNGGAVSRTVYSDLYASIGITFGKGDSLNTFNVPDLRGVFMRGLDIGAGIDFGRIMEPDIQGATAVNIANNSLKIPASAQWQAAPNNTYNLSTDIINTDGIIKSGTQQYYAMRPANVALLACIKY